MSETIKAPSAPYIRTKNKISSIMRDIIIALIPAAAVAVVKFGVPSLIIIAVSVITSAIGELAAGLIIRKKIIIGNLSAIASGLMFALCMPPDIPLWMIIAGSLFSVIILKLLFSMLGRSLINPAVGARCMIILISGGIIAPFMGAESSIAILAGFAYLLIRKVFTPEIPVMFVLCYIILTMIFPAEQSISMAQLLMGACFLAPDFASAPVDSKGKIVFGIGCGALTFVLGHFMILSMAITYAIVVMNLISPLIEWVSTLKCFTEDN